MFPEILEFIEKCVIKFFQDLFGCIFDYPKINKQAILPQFFAFHKDLDFPVVAVKVLTSSLVFSQLVGRCELGDNLQFIHGCLA